MSLSYDVFTEAFLQKINEYDFLAFDDSDSAAIVDGYMRRAIAQFQKICKYDLSSRVDNYERVFCAEIADEDLDELVDIVSEGMIVQWLKPYVYHQENLENVLNTRDFTTYSPAELLMRIGEAYNHAKDDFTQMIREYSYAHGDLTELHL